MPSRNAFRIVRFPRIGPCFEIRGAGKYTSRTKSEYFATSRHQSPASSAVYGLLFTRRKTCAPCSASTLMKASTLAR